MDSIFKYVCLRFQEKCPHVPKIDLSVDENMIMIKIILLIMIIDIEPTTKIAQWFAGPSCEQKIIHL